MVHRTLLHIINVVLVYEYYVMLLLHIIREIYRHMHTPHSLGAGLFQPVSVTPLRYDFSVSCKNKRQPTETVAIQMANGMCAVRVCAVYYCCRYQSCRSANECRASAIHECFAYVIISAPKYF